MTQVLRTVYSKRFDRAHFEQRVRWIERAKTDSKSEREYADFFRRLVCIDAGFPVCKQDVADTIHVFPRFDLIRGYQSPARIHGYQSSAMIHGYRPLGNTNDCPICHATHIQDPVMIQECRHVYCYMCLRTWSNISIPLTCPMCRREVLLRAKSFVRLGHTRTSDDQVFSEDFEYDHVRDYCLGKIFDEWKEKGSGKYLVISDWSHSRARLVELAVTNGVIVTISNLQDASSLDGIDEVVFVDSQEPFDSVMTFLCRFREARRKVYFATEGSIDHFLIDTARYWLRHFWRGGSPDLRIPQLLDRYAEFLKLT